MSSVSRLGRIIVAMRARHSGEASPAIARQPQAPAQAAGSAAQAMAERMRAGVVERLRRIDLNGPQGTGRGLRAFLEVVLTHQLGEGLMLSPRFVEMLAELQAAIEDNPRVNNEIAQLLRELKP